MGWIASGGTSLTVAESDGTPSVSGVSTILVSNTTLTDNSGGSVTIAMTPAGGANTALSNLASVAINTHLLPDDADAYNLGSGAKYWAQIYASTGTLQELDSFSGTPLQLRAQSAAAAASAQAGSAAYLAAADAVAGTTNVGAAVGGSLTLTGGAAARLTSGNANGGDIIITPGAGIGTGTYGILCPSADNILALGSAALRFTTAHASTGFSIYKAVSEANPTATLGDGVLNFGAGTSNAVDVGLKRSSGGVLYVTDGTSGQGDLNAHGLVIADTTMVTNLNADTVDGSHAAAFAGVALSNLASVAINAPFVTGVGTALTLEAAAPITDAAPSTSLLKGADAFPGAATNTTGANTILAGGIGKRIYTIVDYTGLALSTVTVTVNGTATVKTEGTDWFDETSNNATAISLATAIDGIAGVTATASSAVVRIVPDPGTYSLTIAKSAADAAITATSGTDGSVEARGKFVFPDGGADSFIRPWHAGSQRGLEINFDISNSGQEYLIFSHGSAETLIGYLTPSSMTLPAYLVSNDLVALSGTNGPTIGNATQLRWSLGAGATYADWDIGLARSAAGVLKVTDGSSGVGSIIASTAITAVGTAAANGYIRTGVYRRAWTNAEVVAFGAVLSGDLKVATLPAKTVVRNAYLVIDSQAAGTTTLTVSLGRTAAGYIDYTVASDAKVAANTVYGDGSAERGTNLTGYDLPSYVAATDVYVQFIATVANLDQVTSCTGQIYLLTETLP